MGLALLRGGSSIAARALGTSVSPCTTTDNNDGTYSISFTSSVVGDVRVVVRMENVEMNAVTVTCEERRGGKGSASSVAGDEPVADAATAEVAPIDTNAIVSAAEASTPGVPGGRLASQRLSDRAASPVSLTASPVLAPVSVDEEDRASIPPSIGTAE